MKVLILEGISGSGKSSLQSALREIEGNSIHQYLTIDRFIHSCYVFEKLKGAPNTDELDRMYYTLKNNLDITIVYLCTPAYTAYERLRDRGDRTFNNLKFKVEDLIIQQNLFEEALDRYKFETIRIDSIDSPIQSAKRILKELK